MKNSFFTNLAQFALIGGILAFVFVMFSNYNSPEDTQQIEQSRGAEFHNTARMSPTERYKYGVDSSYSPVEKQQIESRGAEFHNTARMSPTDRYKYGVDSSYDKKYSSDEDKNSENEDAKKQDAKKVFNK